eukprot:TRINITY_DN10667_c0_g1_i1.p1 TRINITY_DN10667_c0_g1~~TRINITY_DN10667_c0_g1_i1.p1  ORF type:complete len:415 (-),score=90.24 TRINITY_DN10667_c0_g1_i1:108-1352(-)
MQIFGPPVISTFGSVDVANESTPATDIAISILRRASAEQFQRVCTQIDVDDQDSDGYSALHYACCCDRGDLLAILLERGANCNLLTNQRDSCLQLAVKFDSEECFRTLLQRRGVFDMPDVYGRQSIHTAALLGRLAAVTLLLSLGRDVNVRDGSGNTPLHLAAEQGHTSIVRLLIQNGANVNAMNAASNTPLHLAAVKDHQSVVRVITESGGDLLMRNSQGRTTLELVSRMFGAELQRRVAHVKRPSFLFTPTTPDICPPLDITEHVSTLVNGAVMRKHGRKGRPHSRFMYLSHDLMHLSWSRTRRLPLEGQPADRRIRIADVRDVLDGQQTEVFRRTGRRSMSDRCFSIVTTQRTVDLEAPDAQTRELWSSTMRAILRASYEQRQFWRKTLHSLHGSPLIKLTPTRSTPSLLS